MSLDNIPGLKDLNFIEDKQLRLNKIQDIFGTSDEGSKYVEILLTEIATLNLDEDLHEIIDAPTPLNSPLIPGHHIFTTPATNTNEPQPQLTKRRLSWLKRKNRTRK